MNFIIDKLPTEYGGYKINTDFRVPMKLIKLMDDGDLSEQEKTYISIKMFFPGFDGRHIEELLEYITYYVNRGQESSSDGEAVFDIVQDSGRVYAAFLQVYGIDLLTADMHWWTFLTLLEGLPSGTKLAEVIRIRSTPIPKMTKHNQREVSQLLRLKDEYAIKGKQTVGQKMQSVWEAL